MAKNSVWYGHVFALATAVLSLPLTSSPSHAQTGVVGNALSQPVFVNLYWDAIEMPTTHL
jgi:hypothetical protein